MMGVNTDAVSTIARSHNIICVSSCPYPSDSQIKQRPTLMIQSYNCAQLLMKIANLHAYNLILLYRVIINLRPEVAAPHTWLLIPPASIKYSIIRCYCLYPSLYNCIF